MSKAFDDWAKSLQGGIPGDVAPSPDPTPYRLVEARVPKDDDLPGSYEDRPFHFHKFTDDSRAIIEGADGRVHVVCAGSVRFTTGLVEGKLARCPKCGLELYCPRCIGESPYDECHE